MPAVLQFWCGSFILKHGDHQHRQTHLSHRHSLHILHCRRAPRWPPRLPLAAVHDEHRQSEGCGTLQTVHITHASVVNRCAERAARHHVPSKPTQDWRQDEQRAHQAKTHPTCRLLRWGGAGLVQRVGRRQQQQSCLSVQGRPAAAHACTRGQAGGVRGAAGTTVGGVQRRGRCRLKGHANGRRQGRRQSRDGGWEPQR